MAKRILITCTDSMMKQFLEPHVRNLAENGYEVEIACSEVLNRMTEVRQDLERLVPVHQLHLKRSPLAVSNARGYRELKKLIDSGRYDLIWTNEPVMGVVTRMAARKARKQGTRVMYMVHGFHFYKGAPLPNWMLFCPVERMMASKADCICTINREDYARARKMRTPRAAYIHGVGIDTDRLRPGENPTDLRNELDLPKEAFLVLSVGELNANKNQQVIIRAIARMKDPAIHYVLCGKGDQRQNLEVLARELDIADHIHFLGYRKDIADICRQSDVFALPSRREGLPFAAMEAMYCGLPLVNSGIRGLTDITEDGVSGYICDPDDVRRYAESIQILKINPGNRQQMGARNQKTVEAFTIDRTKQEILQLIRELLD
ncbi:glycosyltransferase family 4 protein [Aristaeella lactis]|uniref:Glycosyltransferase involved in cell wall bisynthesis n=1 Tax=Aristaeella lactis TaxID=3046383 RepID=A0AC61PPH8_9FIRM|nr:glycosyltransferase family 4 protein [Aristaeella lactis]QUA54406.1 glycosyltransferase family 4 protein [Aristaeella lactis]SMC83221.1 Glycosyltransferase involved in cell wall bisynthesis [Aristaeella lactis]